MTSGAYCAVQGCKNQKTMKEISFFKLPTDAKRRGDWLAMIGRVDLMHKPDLKPECHFVCHIHFEEFMMTRKPLLRPNAIPTLNIPGSSPIFIEPVNAPTTKKDRSTQTRRKFYKDLSEGEVRIELVGTFGPKKERKRKLKEKLIESQKKRRQLLAKIKELRKQVQATKARPAVAGHSSNAGQAPAAAAAPAVAPASTVDSPMDTDSGLFIAKDDIKRCYAKAGRVKSRTGTEKNGAETRQLEEHLDIKVEIKKEIEDEIEEEFEEEIKEVIKIEIKEEIE